MPTSCAGPKTTHGSSCSTKRSPEVRQRQRGETEPTPPSLSLSLSHVPVLLTEEEGTERTLSHPYRSCSALQPGLDRHGLPSRQYGSRHDHLQYDYGHPLFRGERFALCAAVGRDDGGDDVPSHRSSGRALLHHRSAETRAGGTVYSGLGVCRRVPGPVDP